MEALFVFGKKKRKVDTNGHKTKSCKYLLEGGDWYQSKFLTKPGARQF
jgi:hypothetical protein